jgi:iron complex outermembrane receptor protein
VLSASNLTELSLEELINIEITSVSKKSEKLGVAAAAIFVITAEDIRRSGVTSIPEALRLAPNLQVARVDSSQYAISARGFNSTTANKLLVLIDGRSVYTPLFSGVFWDVQDVLLEDIERIEVISGPGATLWGSNAVNGVINIISRRSQKPRARCWRQAAARRNALSRVSVTAASYRKTRPSGSMASTSIVTTRFWRAVRPCPMPGTKPRRAFVSIGRGQADILTLQGDIYRGSIDQALFDNKTIEGGNVLGRWTRTWSGDSNLQLADLLRSRQTRLSGHIRRDPEYLRCRRPARFQTG